MRRLSCRRRTAVTLILIGSAMLHAQAGAEPRTLGWLEWAWLQPGHIKVKTKLDTGARTSSIHAVDIQRFERDRERWVRFRIPLAQRPDDSDHGEDLLLERAIERETRIKEHDSESTQRYVVNMDLCIGGVTLTTPVTLADRGGFNYPLLLGRSTLQGHAVIDPARKFTASRSCESPGTD